MRFTNFLSGLGRCILLVFEFVLFVLLIPAFIVVLFMLNIPILIAIFVPILLGTYSITLNWFLGLASGAEFYNTGYVNEGRTVRDIVRDEAYYKRAIYVNFIIMSVFAFLIIYFITVLSFSFGWCLIGLIQSIVGAILFFLLGMSAIEKSRIKNENKMDKKEFAEYFKNKQPIKTEQIITTKFNFDNCPEMKELYLSYKQSKNRTIQWKHDPNLLVQYKQECTKRDEKFEELAKAVYDFLKKENPILINRKTNEKIRWEDLFYLPFEKLSQKEKDYMVRLLDAQPYKFENDKYYN